ncbi:hypothetical protein BGY98DRAFT_1010346 [Russula aff. rugulosa BPL654]|nr:hypothetical protein BGY98DRAFT_1010346 [Russula aff. rugulosa BPL654]
MRWKWSMEVVRKWRGSGGVEESKGTDGLKFRSKSSILSGIGVLGESERRTLLSHARGVEKRVHA